MLSVDFFVSARYITLLGAQYMQFSYKFYKSTVAAWEGMHTAILEAKESIYSEIFMLIDDEVGKPFIDLLCAKAQAGLDVKLVVDAMGSFYLSADAINKLKNAGVKFLFFHRFGIRFVLQNWWRRIWHRTHRKILIVDKKIAFIGGVNVTKNAANWQDLHLRLTGKIVVPMLYAFGRAYVRAGGNKAEVQDLLQPKLILRMRRFKNRVKLILHSPIGVTTRSPFKKFYTQALSTAQESFTLLTPYYAPDKHFLDLVAKAHARGVKINILTPWKTDEPIMRYMTAMLFRESAQAGIVFYFLRAMNHGKAVIIDRKLAMVGSANLTPRSFYINHEAGVVFSDPKMVGDLNQIFEELKQDAVPLSEIDIENSRGPFRKIKDWFMRKIHTYV